MKTLMIVLAVCAVLLFPVAAKACDTFMQQSFVSSSVCVPQVQVQSFCVPQVAVQSFAVQQHFVPQVQQFAVQQFAVKQFAQPVFVQRNVVVQQQKAFAVQQQNVRSRSVTRTRTSVGGGGGIGARLFGR